MNVIAGSDFRSQPRGAAESDAPGDEPALAIALDLVRFHHAIDRDLGYGLFDSPALLMLLELFVARCHGRQTTVKSLTLASGVPQSTAQRWIDRLQAQKLVDKHVNRSDRRSALVTIADPAVIAIRALLGRLDAARSARAETWG